MIKLKQSLMVLAIVLLSGFTFIACGGDPLDKKLTEANYNAIKTDGTTSYEDVVALLGEETEGELEDGAGELTWENKKGTKSITLTFVDDDVTEKDQEGILED